MANVVIDDLDAFRVWLTKTLTPICDADPQALAKYVIALIKKERTAEELKPLCLNQLDVFLQEKTKDFVDTLFLALKNKTYLPPPSAENKPPPPPPAPPTEAEPTVDEKRLSTSDKESVNNVQEDKSAARREDVRNRLGPDVRRRTRSPIGRARSPGRGGRNSPDRIRDRSRERSPMRDRSPLRDRSPGRERSPYRRRTVFDRLDRRRSPGRGRPHRFGSGRNEPRRRRPSLSRSPRRSPLRRSRSPRGRSPRPRSPLRQRSLSAERRRGPIDRNRSLSPRDKKMRSRSPARKFRPRSWSMSSDGLSSHDGSRSRSRSKTPTKSTSSLRGGAGGKTPDSRGSTPRDYSPYNRESREALDARDYVKPPAKPRCRDYDEKGFCLRGDLCPYDHGADPVVVDDASLPSVLQLKQGSQGPAQTANPGQQPPPVVGPGGPPVLPRPGAPVPATSMHFRGPPPGGPPVMATGPGMGPGPLGRMSMNVVVGPPPPPPPGYNVGTNTAKLPPPPGTVPVRMPGGAQGYIQGTRPPMGPGPYSAEPYNPEAPSINAGTTGYFPGRMAPNSANATRSPASRVVYQPAAPSFSGRPMRPMGPMGSGTHTVNARSVQGSLVSISANPSQVPTITEPEAQGPTASNRTVLLGKRQLDQQTQNGSGHSPSKRPHFDQSRLGPKRTFIPNNTALELRKVPMDKNNIGSINEHFARFGLITNLQVCYKGDPNAAVVTFGTHAQASAAYKCTEPIFNNRFVKVFWHNPDNESGSNSENEGITHTNSRKGSIDARFSANVVAPNEKTSIKDRLGKRELPPASKMSLNNIKKPHPQPPQATALSPTGLSKTVFNPEAMQLQPTRAHQAAALQAKQADIAKRKVEIQRKKQTLLQEQLKQQKALISKLESNKSLSAEDKKSILKTVKVLADSIEKLKSELLKKVQPAAAQIKQPLSQKQQHEVKPKQEVLTKDQKGALSVDVKLATPTESQAPPQSPQEKAKAYLETKQKTQRAILDTELDIISKSNSGLDTSALRQKVAELKREASALGLLGGAGRGQAALGRGQGFGRGTSSAEVTGSPSRGRGGAYRGRGRGYTSHVLDRRPKQLHISHFTADEKDEVVAHLASFGAVESIVHDDSLPSMTIDFKTRQDAEQAARDGQAFKNKRLEMAWRGSSPVKPGPSAGAVAARRQSSRDASAVPGAAQEADDEAADEAALGLDDPELEGIDEDVLLGLDEEDEEEEADKSWKR